jgi:MATE family multidrug resistance protein
MVAVLSAVLRASGRQAVGALMNIGGYWALCLPLAWFLGFRCHYGVLGFWIALTICTAVQAMAFGALISRFDWVHEVRRAQVLLASGHRARDSL